MTSFGLAILSNIVVAIGIAVCAYCLGLRRHRSATAHLLWIAVFIKLVTPPLYTIPLPVPDSWYDGIFASSPVPLPAVDMRPIKAVPEADNRFATQASRHENHFDSELLPSLRLSGLGVYVRGILPWSFVTVWLVVACCLIVKGVVKFIRFSRLLRERAERCNQGCLDVRYLLADRGGSRAPSVLLIPIDMAPMLFGIGKSTSIVCPRRLWDVLSTERRRAFLAHELAHYVRRDHWVRWLEWIVSSLYWWLPLTYFARSQLERNEEIACDQWAVTQFNIRRREYAETLLQVVDFLEDSRIASHRLASRMQSTDLLESRVKSILKVSAPRPMFSCSRSVALALVGLTLAAHPYPYRHSLAHTRDSSQLSAQHLSPAREPPLVTTASVDRETRAEERNLPHAPTGWWSTIPGSDWADIRLPNSGVRLRATAGTGLRLELASGHKLVFPYEQLSACAEITGTDRIVIADASGALRIWDVTAGAAISFIGNHATAITSVAFDQAGGLVAADVQGSVIHWDHLSGAPLRTWTTQSGPVQSIRWSRSGKSLAVLLGNWSDVAIERQLVVLDAHQFEEQSRRALPSETAVVWDDDYQGWLSVDWQGYIHTLSGEVVSRISKQSVSALVLSQNAIVPIDPQLHAAEDILK